jgi:aspartyl-tRNA(Asn)/glutamyl-tRNA(Gln) amidotransferase subunit B
MNIRFEAYETVIGFECHVQLKTKSKLFSRGPNLFGRAPNELVDVVDVGLPGVLPTANLNAVLMAIRLGLSLSCEINRKSIFARKHYFYPDLPKGYQISQFDKPICEHGVLPFFLDGKEKSIRIRRIHLEEDAGKNTHADGTSKSYVDFNRAGTPLLEVVTEPDLRSPEETMAALKALHRIVTFIDICDGNMQEGSLRADINVSVRARGDEVLGTRTETKNLNSFRYIGQAIAFEARRQIIEIESGKKIEQETRLWNPGSKESRSMRSKEEAHDYRYFPDPDLLPLVVSDQMVQSEKAIMPELPHAKLLRYQQQYELSAYDAGILSSQRDLASYFEKALLVCHHPKTIANWIINETLAGSLSKNDDEDNFSHFSPPVGAEALAGLVELIENKTISNSIGKKVYALLEKNPEKSAKEIVIENKWQVVSDEASIDKFVCQVLDENPAEVTKYLEGKTKVLGFLMGQLMKVSKGSLDPASANSLMLDALKKRGGE